MQIAKKWLLTLMGVFTMLGFFSGSSNAAETKTAVFAGGCFWCMESEFAHVNGVSEVVSGYTGGQVDNPTYEQVSSGATGHFEAVQVTYDPAKVSYEKLLDIFWTNIDPTNAEGQFCDIGSQYRTGIFVADEEQKKLAEASLKDVQERLGVPIATETLPFGRFWRAEDYHQQYYKKNAARYKLYRWGCGRDQTLDEIWGDKPAEKR